MGDYTIFLFFFKFIKSNMEKKVWGKIAHKETN